MDLDVTLWTELTALQVLDDTALTEGVQTLGDCGRIDKVPRAQRTHDVWVDVAYTDSQLL